MERSASWALEKTKLEKDINKERLRVENVETTRGELKLQLEESERECAELRRQVCFGERTTAKHDGSESEVVSLKQRVTKLEHEKEDLMNGVETRQKELQVQSMYA